MIAATTHGVRLYTRTPDDLLGLDDVADLDSVSGRPSGVLPS